MNDKTKAAIVAVLDEIEVTIPMRNNLSAAFGRRDLQHRFAGRNEYRREVRDIIDGIRERIQNELLKSGSLIMLPGLMECPRCEGEGKLKYKLGQHPGPFESHNGRCPDCSGTGMVHREIQNQPQA